PAKAAQVATRLIGAVATEQCAPFSAIVNRFNDQDVRQLERVQELEKKVDEFTEGRAACIECIVDLIKNDFPGIKDLAAVRSSLDFAKQNLATTQTDQEVSVSGSGSKDSIGFELFLKDLTIKAKCDQEASMIDISNTSRYLNRANEGVGVDELSKFIGERLKRSEPVIISSICMDSQQGSVQQCTSLHTIVVTGEATRCHPSGKPCAKAYRVHNSWGQSWQHEFNGGWVSAENLLSRVRTVGGYPALTIN
ncbi:MAG: hypothetical protein ACK5RO_07725, partial [Pseudobdellovibrionaceae bacterium]